MHKQLVIQNCHIHIHLITNLMYKNDHTSKHSVGSLKLGYNLQNVIQTALESLSQSVQKKTSSKMEHSHHFLFQSH
jgi:hypothetical protein